MRSPLMRPRENTASHSGGSRGWSTDGLTLGSTESRPVACQRARNSASSAGIPASAPTITSSTSRSIPMATAGSGVVELPSNPRSCRWGRRRSRWAVARKGLKPVPKKALMSLRIDSDVIEWFKSQGSGYQTRMNALLRAYMEAHK